MNENKDLNQVHFVVGTYDELSTKGVLRKEGGFLMFGKKNAVVEEVESSQFSHIDGRQFRGLPFEGDKFEIVSKHPSNSFNVVEEDDQTGKKYLEILDAEEFWKLSKYLVVSVR